MIKMKVTGKSIGAMIVYVVLCLILAAGVIAGIGYVFMSLWNWLVPDLFDGPAITFWQSVGLWFLIAIVANLFRGGK